MTAENAGKLGKGKFNTAKLLGGPDIDHYHQAIAVVVAETFEQATAAAALIRVEYAPADGRFDLEEALKTAPLARDPNSPEKDGPPESRTGDFEKAFAQAPVKLDELYTTPDQGPSSMMEPHASIAVWNGDKLTVWTSNQMIDWGRAGSRNHVGHSQGERPLRVALHRGRLWLQAVPALRRGNGRAGGEGVRSAGQSCIAAAVRSKQYYTPPRHPTAHPDQGQQDGRIIAIAHESGSGDLPDGQPETATNQTRLLYAGPNRLTSMRLAVMDLPEGNAMRAPGEAPGMMALEIAMDELAEKLGLDPVELRVRNDTQVDPEKPDRPFSQRNLVRCLREGADRFGWMRRSATPGAVRDGHWLVGMGTAAAFRNNLLIPFFGRARQAWERWAGHRRNRHDRHRHRQLYDHRADRRRDDGRRF